MLTDLAEAARSSGLEVIELPGSRTNRSGGSFDPEGILVHHTGSYDGLHDAVNDRQYAEWLAFQGRSDLPPPLCNLTLSAGSVVYVCAAGNANHAGYAQASGPMPAASDGNSIYVGIEAMNSGSQGWDTVGRDASGDPLTQYEGYVRLCAAICRFNGWPASHVRAHKETSVTGKWDPGGLDMGHFRRDIEALLEGDEMNEKDWDRMSRLIDQRLAHFDFASKIKVDVGKKNKWSIGTVLRNIRDRQRRDDDKEGK